MASNRAVNDLDNEEDDRMSEMQYQVTFVKHLQEQINELLKQMDSKGLSKDDLKTIRKQLNLLQSKSQQVIVLLQVMTKVKGELAHAQFNYEKSLKMGNNVEQAQKRVIWLESRLQQLLFTSRALCHFDYAARGAEKQTTITEKELSPTFLQQLSNEQKNRLLWKGEDKNEENHDLRMTTKEDIESEIERVLSIKLNDVSVSDNGSVISEVDDDRDNQRTVSRQSLNQHKSALQSSDTSEKIFITENHNQDNQKSISRLSLNQGRSAVNTTSSEKAFVAEEVDDNQDDQRAESTQSPNHLNQDKSLIQNSTMESIDKVNDYWTSDHHRFEWVNFMQKLNPLSWHSLAISYPDSFLKRGEHSIDKISWKMDGKSIGETDFDRKSLEKLQNKLTMLFQSVEDAAVNSVNMKFDKQSTFLTESSTIRGQKETLKSQSNRMNQPSDERANEDQQLPPLKSPGLGFYGERCSKLFSRPVSVVLPVVKQNADKQYPRCPDVWCDISKINKQKNISYIRSPRQTLKDVPTISKKKTQRESTSRASERRMSLKKAASRIKAVARFRANTISTRSSDDLKWKRILDLLGEAGIGSSNEEIVLDSLRCLSKLGSCDSLILEAIRSKINEETNKSILYEASKCLITLGSWDVSAVKILLKGLEQGNEDLRIDILDTLSTARNAQFVSKKTPAISKLIEVLIQMTKLENKRISFAASLSLGHLCVPNAEAKRVLIHKLQDPSFAIRDQALKSLVRQMNCKDQLVIDSLLHQISNANNWKHRVNAADLLLFIGVKGVTSFGPDKVFDTLEKLLWNHPNADLRSKIADVINEFGMRPKAMFLVYKRLDDLDESLRSNAIMMLSTLRMKSEKELKTLLDILELDSSINVRTQVVRAFNSLKWNDPRVIKSLQEKDKGDGPIAQEAKNTLATFGIKT